jgi:hypothetical protein
MWLWPSTEVGVLALCVVGGLLILGLLEWKDRRARKKRLDEDEKEEK